MQTSLPVLTRREALRRTGTGMGLLGLAALPSISWAGAGRVKDRVDIATDKAATFILGMQAVDGSYTDPGRNARQSAKQSYATTALGIAREIHDELRRWKTARQRG